MICNIFVVDNYSSLNDNDPTMKIYNTHYRMMQDYAQILNEMIFIITYNNLDYTVINSIKAKLIDVCHNCKSITFITEQNDYRFREGIIFKKYVIDKLNDYDGLTFWCHFKGVTNPKNTNNLINSLKWIYMMYYSNILWFHEMKNKLDDKEKYISYGTLYYKDYRHNTTYNWFYSGSFFWLNTKKLYAYIEKKNIDISDFISPNDENLMRCAEIFLGQVYNEHYAAFHYDEHYNKEYNNFLNYGIELSYNHIDEQIKLFFKPYEYMEFLNNFNALLKYLNT